MSQKISILDPDCITSDGTSLYAHAVINVGAYSVNNQFIVLLKSNAYPSSLTDVSWKVVSTTSQNKLYILQSLASIKGFICHVDSQGVFTILATASKSFATDQAPSQPRGYQYDPANGGTWSNVDVTDGYGWSIITRSVMLTLDNQLVHMFNTDIIKDTITVAIFDKATRKFIPQNATWSLPPGSGKPYSFTVRDNNLYVLSGILSSNVFLNILPLKTVAPPAANEFTVIPAQTIRPSCPLIPNAGTLETSVVGSNFYLFCSDTGRQRNFLVTSDSKTFGVAVPANTTIHSPESFIPVYTPGGPPTWAFMNSGGTTYSLSLTGNIGAWQEASYKINATGLSGPGSSDSGPSGGSSGDSGSSSSGGGGLSLTEKVALIVCLVLAVIIGVPAIWKCIRKRRKVKKVAEVVHALNQPYPHVPEQQLQQQQQQLLQQQQQQLLHHQYRPTYPQLPFETTAAHYDTPAPAYTTEPIVYEIKGDIPTSANLTAPTVPEPAVTTAQLFIPTSPIATIPQSSVQPIQNVQGYQEYPQGDIGYTLQYRRPGGPQGDGHEPIPTSGTLYVPGPQGPLHDTGNQHFHQ